MQGRDSAILFMQTKHLSLNTTTFLHDLAGGNYTRKEKDGNYTKKEKDKQNHFNNCPYFIIFPQHDMVHSILYYPYNKLLGFWVSSCMKKFKFILYNKFNPLY